MNEKLGADAVAKLQQKWPQIDFNHNSIRDILRKMDINTLSNLYAKGLEINCAWLTVLAAEALINYSSSHGSYLYHYTDNNASIIKDTIVQKLQDAFDRKKVIMGSNLVNRLGLALLDNCYESDRLLAKYGQQLSRGVIFMGPEDWLVESAKQSKFIPVLAQDILWAKTVLND